MDGVELRNKRFAAGITGSLLCRRVAMDKSRFSNIERGYVQVSQAEMNRLTAALDELIEAKTRMIAAAEQYRWPVSAL